MKKILYTLAAIMAMSLLSVADMLAQSVVTARATAEIIDAVTLYADAVTDFDITNSQDVQDFSMGAVKLNTSRAITYNVVVKPAVLNSDSGNSFTVQPTVAAIDQTNSAVSPSHSTLNITGNAREIQEQKPGNYQGSYSVVFAYN